jgi:hypothetical protein
MKEATMLIGQGLAYMAKTFVINANGTIDEEMFEALPANDEDRAILRTIMGAYGQVLAGPMGPEEGILYADVDLEDTVRGKFVHDFSGHYNRADVFQLNVSTASSPIYNPIAGPSPAVGGTMAPSLAWMAPVVPEAMRIEARGPVAALPDGEAEPTRRRKGKGR